MSHQHETNGRSLLKSLTWWVSILAIDLFIIFFIIHDPAKTLLAVLVTNVVGLAAYFLHERLWSKVLFGLRPHRSTDPN